MKTILNSKSDKREIIKVTGTAYKTLPELCKYIAQETGMDAVTFIDAASLAIKEAHIRRQRRETRRLLRTQS